MNECRKYIGEMIVNDAGNDITVSAYELVDCSLSTNRILDSETYAQLELQSTLTTAETIQTLFPPVEILAGFTGGFLAVFGLAAIAYKIKVVNNIINKI